MTARPIYIIIFLLCFYTSVQAGRSRQLLDEGWKEMVKDNDTTALRFFNMAYEQAIMERDTVTKGLALLNIGICYYSVSYSKGMEYCILAMNEFKKLEKDHPLLALEGRSKCLQLVSTINSRQGKYREAIAFSKEAMMGFPVNADTTGYLGLIYNSLGSCYKRMDMRDSAVYYQEKALEERLRSHDMVYLPGSYLAMADILLERGQSEKSLEYYQRALSIADSTGNRQSQVSSLLGIGKWYLKVSNNTEKAEQNYRRALQLSSVLTDKIFYLKTIERLLELKKIQGDYRTALVYKEEWIAINDTMHSWDKQNAIKKLEIQFDVAEKDRLLRLAQKEKEVTLLTNYLLAGSVVVLLLGSMGAIYFLRRINKRDKQLLTAKEALVQATEEQKRLREQQMQNEIEFKESQLSALTLQMLQKNELLQELRQKMEEDKVLAKDQSIHKIISKGMNQDKEWSDFNQHFESINRNFYSRLKTAYPDISPNDLKICALIKMNLSIKEMAGILNISPDSVKTARYRLRKKLQLNTEDNLTEFIMNL